MRAGTATRVAPDGSIWSLVDGDLVRTTSTTTQVDRLGVDADALLSLVGNVPLVVDVSGRRARFGDGAWHSLPTDADPSEILAQVPGPPSGCGWVGADDDLWCVSADGIDETATVAGLDLDGGDFLAIAGEAAAVGAPWTELDRPLRLARRRAPRRRARIGRLRTPTLAVTATVDLVWVDDVAGDFVWGVNPWSVQAIDKNARESSCSATTATIVEAGEPGEARREPTTGQPANPRYANPTTTASTTRRSPSTTRSRHDRVRRCPCR